MTSDLFESTRARFEAELEKAHGRYAAACREVEQAEQQRDQELARVDVWIEALAALDEQAKPAPAEPRKRLDIGAAILEVLGEIGELTVSSIAAQVGRKPSQITPAINRLVLDGTVELVPGTVDSYRLPKTDVTVIKTYKVPDPTVLAQTKVGP